MNYFYTNGTPVINSLKVTSEVPLDPRLNVENIAERDSLVTNHISYDRMKVYVKSTDTKYIYHKDTGEWEIDNKYSEDDKAKLDNITDYLIDTEHIYNPENKLLFREHVYTPVSDTNTLRDHILQEARVAENGELYNGLLSKFYVNRLNNVTNYLTNLSFTKATDVADLYLTTHSYNPDNKVITKTNINIPVATDANNGLLSNIQNIKLNRIINYVNDIDTKHTNDATVGLKYNYNIYNPNTNSNVTKTIVIPLATDTENGLQSNIEHIKLGRIIDYMTEFSSYTNDSKGLKYVYKKYNPNTNVTTNHDVIIPLVTHSLNGLLSSTDKIKIDDIETYVKSIALRQASGTEELGIDYVITNPNNQTDTPGFFNLPLVTDLRNGLVSPARKHWMDNANGLSNTGTTSDTWQLKKKDIDTKIDPNGGLILKSSGENLEVRTKTDTGYANLIMNDITIKGNVTQEGSSFITEAETVEVKDNTLLLNRGEVGAGVTKGFAGIEIDRGTLPKFQILFNESDRRFKAGEEGDLWCLALRDNDADMVNGMFVSWDSTTKRLKTTNIVPLGKGILFDATMDAYKFNIRNLGNTLFRIETPSVSSAYLDLKFVNKATFATGMAGFQFEKPVYISGNLAGYSSTLVFSVDNTLTSKLTINKDKATFSIPVYGTTFYRNSDSSEVLYHADIINNLTSGGADKVLSAEQGKALKKITDDINTDLSTNYLPLTAGSGKALTGMLYADKGVRIPKGESIYTSNIAGTDSVSLVRISSAINYNLSIGVQTPTSNQIELVADFVLGTPNDKAGTSLGAPSKRFSNVFAAVGDFSTSVTSLLLKSIGNAEVSKTLSVGDDIQMSNQTAVRFYNGTKYANALWGNDDILTVGQDYPYVNIGLNNGHSFATFSIGNTSVYGSFSAGEAIDTPKYISATQGFKVQGNRVTALNRPNVVSMSNEVVSFPNTATNTPGSDSISGLIVNDGFCTTYFWDGDFAVQLALDIDGTGVAYRGYTPSTGASIRGWKFLATTEWTNGQLTDIRGKYLPLTGGTLSGNLIFNNNINIWWKNASGTDTAQMYLNGNNVLVVGNTSNAELYLRTGAGNITHERAGTAYSIWDTYNLAKPAKLDVAQTFTSTNTFSNTIIANAGIQIGSTADIGWYNYNSRIAAGTSTARGVNVGSLLVSSVWADSTKVPTNGMYVKGVIHSDSRIIGTSFSHPTKIDWTPELVPDKTNNALLQILDNPSSTGAPTNYATILQINSRIAHWATQLYIDQSNDNAAAGKIRYRTSKYDSTTYSPFKVIATEDWTTSNFAKYAGGTTLYQRNLGVNGSQWTFVSTVNSGTTSIYAPTTVGTSGQLLQSTGGTPTWVNASTIMSGYLPLSGGTLTGNLTLNTNALIATNAYNKWGLTFNSSNTASYGVYIGLDTQSTECLGIGSNSASTKVKFKMGQKTIAINTFVSMTNADLEIGTGYISSPKIIKQGGTSAQFLKADGSVDSNAYATQTWANGLFINAVGGTDYVNISLPTGVISSAGAAKYLEWWDSTPGWYNFKTGSVTAVGEVHASAGVLKSTNNSNTVTIGSQNSSFCHFSNSAAIPFHFNRDVKVAGNLYMGSGYDQLVATQNWVTGRGYITSHQSIYAATFSAGAFSAVTYTPNSAAKTISIPTHTSHLTNNSGFITSASLSGYIPTSGTSTITTKIIVGGAARNCGIIGTYDSTKTQQIWAMGTSYLSNAAGSDFGGLYGLAYKHTNNTTGGTMAGGHQMVWCQNGSPSCALGDNVWTSGNVSGKRFISSQATGTSPFSIASTTVNTNLNADMVDGQHFSYSNTSNTPTYLWATNSNGTNFLASRTSITVGNATNATTATKWAGYDIWVGTAAQLPSSRVATTIYFVKA